MVAAGGVVLASILGIRAIAGERDRLAEEGRIEAAAALAQVERDIALTMQQVASVRAYLERSLAVTPREFARFTEDVAPPGRTPWRAIAIAMGTDRPGATPWNRYREAFADEYSAEAYPAFEPFPRDSTRPLRSAVVLVAPADTRRNIFGFDMTSDSVRADAIARARASGEVEVTEAVNLTQDTIARPASILLVASVSPAALYAGADFGIVAASITPSALLGAALDELGLTEVRYRAALLTAAGDTVTSFRSSAARTAGFVTGSLRTAAPWELEIPLGPDRLVVEWQPGPEAARAPLRRALPAAGAVLLVSVLTVLLIGRIEGEQARLARVLAQRERELRTSEEAVAQSQRREALGRLTGGVAHDFNNLLSVVIGSLDLMEDRVAGDPEAARHRENALAAAGRGARLTQRLLTLGRQATLQFEVFDVREALLASEALLRASVPEKIELVIQPGHEASWVRADRTQLEAGLLNLVINARDAMPDGGILTISRFDAQLPLESGHTPEVPAGPYVVLSVRDTGVGMSPEVRRAATDPFFTTKEAGVGSGLGLSTVVGFARQSGGDVLIESVEGRGTEVRIFLPRTDPARESPVTPGEPEPTASPATHILVVEDEDAVRKVIRRQLEQLGFQVDTAASGDRALAILDEGARPDLVLSDVVMPGLNDGGDVARVARRMGLPVILMSGYPRGLAESGAPGDVPLLAKPFRIEELVRAIREELAKSEGAADPVEPED